MKDERIDAGKGDTETRGKKGLYIKRPLVTLSQCLRVGSFILHPSAFILLPEVT